MTKIIIFGNSGAGKSTLAKAKLKSLHLAHLDLDTLAWQPIPPGDTAPPGRMPLELSRQQINAFTVEHSNWVIEGCYTDLLELVSDQADEIIFMDLSVASCIENAKNRPWEPHKYPSKAAQDSNLAMLIQWIESYTEREDTFSAQSHQRFYDVFAGKKTRLTANPSN